MATNVSAGTDGNSLFLMHLAHVVMKFSLRNRARAIREFIALIRVMRDFICGFRVLHFVGSCVTVFGKMKNSPVRHHGHRYWDEILPFIDKMAKAGMIAPSDLELVHAINSIEDAIAHVRTHATERFGLHAAR